MAYIEPLQIQFEDLEEMEQFIQCLTKAYNDFKEEKNKIDNI